MTDGSDSLMGRLMADEALRNEVKAATSPEDVLRLLADAGIGVTLEDIAMAETAQPQLSDADLEAVAGGTGRFVSMYVQCEPSPPTQVYVLTHCLP